MTAVPLRTDPTAAAIPDSFTVVNAARSETFALGEDFTAYGVGRHLTLRGVNKVIALGLWSRPEGMKGGPHCPDVAELFALASDVSAPEPDQSKSIPSRTATSSVSTPVVSAPTAPAAIAPAGVPAAVRPALTVSDADAPNVVADRVNGRRSSAGAEDVRAQYGWDAIIAEINAEPPNRG
jgi:hypothetical protein